VKREVAVWFGIGSKESIRLYPMVMFEDKLGKRYHYRVKPASLARLQRVVRRSCKDPFIGPRGWSVVYDD
jgi:hypothetical protein